MINIVEMKNEYIPVQLTGDAGKYIAIPSSIILNKDMDVMRVAVYSFFMFRRGLDNYLYFSINAIIGWFNKRPNRNRNGLNEKILNTVNALSDGGYLTYSKKAFDRVGKGNPIWEQFVEASFDTVSAAQQNNHNRFAILYLDEIKAIMNYQGNPKDAYLNSFSLLLVFAYLRMSIMRRSNQYRLDEDIFEKQIQFPEAYNDYYKDIADELGISVRTFGKIVNCLRDELHLIQFEEIGRTKYIISDGKTKWKTNHTIFCNAYKREKNYLLTDSESYWTTEIANKKQKIGIKGD